MSGQKVDSVSTLIDAKLRRLCLETSRPCIFRVQACLRNENEKAYEPEIVAIGPYHHGKPNLQEMEKYKLLYLKLLLQRRQESSVDIYVKAMREMEERARKCYVEINTLDGDGFVEMMILDGCFIIEFIRELSDETNRDDPILDLELVRNNVCRDLILFENQVPFFILVCLFHMTNSTSPNDSIIDLSLNFLMSNLTKQKYPPETKGISPDNVKHLLHLMHFCWCSSFVEMHKERNTTKQLEDCPLIKSTTELQESGIKLKMAEESRSVLEIKFENGVLEIPPLDIEDHTECLLRNLIAYEQYCQGPDPRYITDYTTFMDCLINSAKDAEILRHCGIVNNWLGDDEAISTMFNKLGNNVEVNLDLFCYKDVFDNVNQHCRRRWNIQLANLRHNYFNSPWSTISFLAAALLLLLTLLQTIFSALSYWKQSRKLNDYRSSYSWLS